MEKRRKSRIRTGLVASALTPMAMTSLAVTSLLVALCMAGCGGRPVYGSLLSGAEKVAAVAKMPNKNPTGELVLAVPGMDEVSVGNVTYKNDLTADIYYPPGFLEDEAREPLPFVLIVNIFTREHYQDWYGMARKDCRDNVDWGRLYAASGMAVVFYEADSPSDDVFDLLDFLKRNRRRLRLDMDRIGLHAFSGHSKLALRLAAETKASYARGVKAALFLHAQMKSPRPLRQDVPLFVVYTREDGTDMADLNEVFVRRARARNVPITVADDAGWKGFHFQDPSERSREIVQELVRFLQSHLGV